MKVLVTGAHGQLGQDLLSVMNGRYQCLGLSRRQLDICDTKQVRTIVSRFQPDVVIHAAAYTAVDKAERDVEEAFRVNVLGTRNVAAAVREVGAKFCYISTDYVFDGTAAKPYQEHDRPRPLNVYGESKLAGEVLAAAMVENHFIVRTSWLYGASGPNFVTTMLRLAKQQEEISVVGDQIGSPTYTQDLARTLAEIVRTDAYGIYHAANGGACSWYQFAQAIFHDAGTDVKLRPCTTAEFPRPAQRPKNSVLGGSTLVDRGFSPLRPWRAALQDYLSDLACR
jgi:dTDP-4-dehydrorhamnose reductase